MIPRFCPPTIEQLINKFLRCSPSEWGYNQKGEPISGFPCIHFHSRILHPEIRCCYVPSAKHISLITYTPTSHLSAIPHRRSLSESPNRQQNTNALWAPVHFLVTRATTQPSRGGGEEGTRWGGGGIVNTAVASGQLTTRRAAGLLDAEGRIIAAAAAASSTVSSRLFQHLEKQ